MSKAVELLVKYNGNLKAVERELKIQREEAEKELAKWNLKLRSAYRTFVWKTQFMMEQKIAESHSVTNNDMIEHLMKTWKSEENQPYPKEVFSAFLDRSLLSNENQRKGYIAICAGNLEYYNTYIPNDARLFCELASRFLLHFFGVKEKEPFMEMVLKISEHIFDYDNMGDKVFKTLRHLDFQTKMGMVLEKNVEAAIETIPLEKWPFYEGMTTILMDQLDKRDDPLFRKMRDRISERYQRQKQTEEEPFSHEKQEADTQIPVMQEEGHQKTEMNREKEREGPASARSVLIDRMIETAVQLRTVTDTDAYLAEKVKELEEENKRLYTHIEKMEAQKKDLQYTKLLEVFEAIAGKSSRYLLSELYNSTANHTEVDVGRFKNLFNELRIAGIEPVSYGFNVNQEFTLTKEKLRDQFVMTKPIVSEGSRVTVRLIQQGWSMNDRILVFPLAEEVVVYKTSESQQERETL